LSDTGKDVAEGYGVLQAEYEGMRRVHERSLFLIDPDRTVRLAITVDIESPEDVEIGPLVDAIREIRA